MVSFLGKAFGVNENLCYLLLACIAKDQEQAIESLGDLGEELGFESDIITSFATIIWDQLKAKSLESKKRKTSIASSNL